MIARVIVGHSLLNVLLTLARVVLHMKTATGRTFRCSAVTMLYCQQQIFKTRLTYLAILHAAAMPVAVMAAGAVMAAVAVTTTAWTERVAAHRDESSGGCNVDNSSGDGGKRNAGSSSGGGGHGNGGDDDDVDVDGGGIDRGAVVVEFDGVLIDDAELRHGIRGLSAGVYLFIYAHQVICTCPKYL